jgi:AcrR family transcriptional regulator
MADSSKTRTSRDEQAAASRQQIMDAALVLFAERGFAGTSTRRIAKKAGVSEGLIFHHFPTKQDVLRTIVTTRRTMPTLVAELLEGARTLAVTDFAETVAKSFVQLLSPGRPEAQLFRVILGESHRDAELFSVVENVQGELFARVARYLESRIETGELREDLSPEIAARCLFGPLLAFFIANHRVDADIWHARGEPYAKGVVDFWLRGARRDARSPEERS